MRKTRRVGDAGTRGKKMQRVGDAVALNELSVSLRPRVLSSPRLFSLPPFLNAEVLS
ncbi:hypothetical protein [Nostoc linckia]|uniref:hypothetical protein n=1 Tax=Nostoc linckia TaxID=92942 RepID=UPI0015D4B7BC|nr:hypothetical protein [Nostoc linckia]